MKICRIKLNNERKFMLEKQGRTLAKINFLLKINEMHNSSDKIPIFYLDEISVFQNQSRNYILQDSSQTLGIKVPTGKEGTILYCYVQD
jgi:hypothetical protein